MREQFQRSPQDDRDPITFPVLLRGVAVTIPKLLGFRNKENDGLMRVEEQQAIKMGLIEGTVVPKKREGVVYEQRKATISKRERRTACRKSRFGR